ncbi:MAG TPA: GNAT family N-acetyltransferase [Myxococcaceae bacterium]|nr:GNAT family N-acetyltransferase [Myxococcaceae bacterium]
MDGTASLEYRFGNVLDLDEVIELYRASTLGERRPIQDRDRMGLMLKNANLVVTCWDKSLLVGIARSVSDFVYTTYLSDLAVRLSHQRRGIGQELIRRSQHAAPQAKILLVAAPNAADYYPHIGFTPRDAVWVLKAGAPIGSSQKR